MDENDDDLAAPKGSIDQIRAASNRDEAGGTRRFVAHDSRRGFAGPKLRSLRSFQPLAPAD
jgi:hypothetical protein